MKHSKFIGAIACLFGIMSCNQTTPNYEEGYIGPSDIKLTDGIMTPEALLSFGRLSDPQISPDGAHILYGVSYTSIADNRSCRNLFVCNTDGSGKAQLSTYGKSVSNARWSNDGKSIFFLMGSQIWQASYENGSLGTPEQLSDVAAGISGFTISPDESRIMYISSIHSAVQTPSDSDPALDKAEAYATEDLMYRHWDHWVTDTPRSYVAAFGKGKITPENSTDILGCSELYELPTEPFGGTEQLCWSPDSRFIAYSCRKAVGKRYAFSTDSEIYIYNVESGQTICIDMKGGYDTDPVWSPDGSRIAWLSMERDGYEADKTRLFVQEIDIKGAEPVLGERVELTSRFKYNAAGPVWAEDSRSIYFNALAEGLQGIFKASCANPDAIERITPDNAWYDFDSPFAATDGKLLTTYCSMNFPTEMVAVEETSGSFSQISDENGHILSQLEDIETEMRYVKTVDGKDMLTWVLYPPQFDKSRKYPVIEICLGGPQGTLSQSWSYRWNYRLMASQGYIVVLPNRRGTTAFGKEWTEQISGDYSGLNIQDYLSAAREIKAEPFAGKIAACGASYGGYSVYYLAGVHGDTYDCFIAHAGIYDEAYLYQTTEEMWFANWDNGGLTETAFDPAVGTLDTPVGPAGDGVTFGGIQQAGSPWSNKSKTMNHYSHSPSANVTKWHTPILCIHGGMDFRIPYDQGMAAFNSAQMMGVPSRLVVFPTENHWILQPQNALYWHREYFGWLERWIK